MELRDILRQIRESDRQLLLYALESDLPQWVEYSPGKFVGVNVQPSQLLAVERTCGAYQIGLLIREELK